MPNTWPLPYGTISSSVQSVLFFTLLFNQVTDTNGSKRRVTAETLVIATGDSPQYPGIPGDREYCVTRSPSTQTRHSVPTSKEMSKIKIDSLSPPSEDLLSLPHPPGRTLVVGGSAEGLESAGFLFGLGLPVTVMQQRDLLQGFDQKTAQKIENHMIVSGVKFLYHCSLTKVQSKTTTGTVELNVT